MAFGMWSALTNALMAKKSNKELNKLLAQDPNYATSAVGMKNANLAGNRFGLANQLFYGRMFGAPELERNILSGQGTYNSQVNRNATDASQALAMSAAGQGNTDKQFQNLQIQEAQNKYGLLNNLNEAYGGMINEGDKDYSDQLRRFGDLSSIRGAQMQNRAGAWQGLWNGLNSDFNDAASIFGISQGGGLGNLFSGGNKAGQQGSRMQNNPQMRNPFNPFILPPINP